MDAALFAGLQIKISVFTTTIFCWSLSSAHVATLAPCSPPHSQKQLLYQMKLSAVRTFPCHAVRACHISHIVERNDRFTSLGGGSELEPELSKNSPPLNFELLLTDRTGDCELGAAVASSSNIFSKAACNEASSVLLSRSRAATVVDESPSSTALSSCSLSIFTSVIRRLIPAPYTILCDLYSYPVLKQVVLIHAFAQQCSQQL